MQHKISFHQYNFFVLRGEGIATKIFYGDHFTIGRRQKVIFFEKLSLEPSMDVLSKTFIQVVDSTHYNTENV